MIWELINISVREIILFQQIKRADGQVNEAYHVIL